MHMCCCCFVHKDPGTEVGMYTFTKFVVGVSWYRHASRRVALWSVLQYFPSEMDTQPMTWDIFRWIIKLLLFYRLARFFDRKVSPTIFVASGNWVAVALLLQPSHNSKSDCPRVDVPIIRYLNKYPPSSYNHRCCRSAVTTNESPNLGALNTLIESLLWTLWGLSKWVEPGIISIQLLLQKIYRFFEIQRDKIKCDPFISLTALNRCLERDPLGWLFSYLVFFLLKKPPKAI